MVRWGGSLNRVITHLLASQKTSAFSSSLCSVTPWILRTQGPEGPSSLLGLVTFPPCQPFRLASADASSASFPQVPCSIFSSWASINCNLYLLLLWAYLCAFLWKQVHILLQNASEKPLSRHYAGLLFSYYSWRILSVLPRQRGNSGQTTLIFEVVTCNFVFNLQAKFLPIFPKGLRGPKKKKKPQSTRVGTG